MSDIFLFAGEASGDGHGASVVQELKRLHPELTLEGVAGPKMRNLGVKPFLKMEEFQVMGFTDVMMHFPKLYKYFYQVRDHILATNPKVLVLIDYPGFNLRLSKSLRKKGWKGQIVHYICPSVWAWGKDRIKTLSDNVDELLTIYPFEKNYFQETPLKVSYIGNPVVEAIEREPTHLDWRAVSGLPDPTETLIAIFPGSRQGEIERNLKVQLDALKLIKEKLPHATFVISVISPKLQAVIAPILAESKIKVHLVPSHFNYELMKECSTAIAKSGTVTLELALLKRPTVVVYGLSKLNRFIAKYLIRLKLPYYCIVNILCQKKVFPELIEKGFNAETIAEETLRLETDPVARQKTLEGCDEVKRLLGTSSASKNAAEAIFLQCAQN